MRKVLLILAFFAALSGCVGGGNVSVPVIDKSPDRVIPEAYRATKGDSIYKIAWAFGLDYEDIAEWNNLKEPYAISEGQVIALQKGGTSVSDPAVVSKPETVVHALPGKPKEEPIVQPSGTGEKVNFSTKIGKWSWPAEGELVMRFAPAKGINGIHIAGQEGSPIRATAQGEVVYIGEGLRGYGKLIILKHPDNYVSAYAHNRDIQVSEGQQIALGEQIATMGDSGADSVKLHFEIRKSGNPVDPVKLLK